MEIIKSKLNKSSLKENKNISKDMCFFDIETTGFNRNNDIIYLIGILYFDSKEDCWTISQYFANELKDEPKLLIKACKLLTSFETIINYNGNTFDIPFINHKLKAYDLPFSIDKEKSLDLYSILRKNKDLLKLKNLKLKTVEEYLGIYRQDIYSGKDCINFYKDYILDGNLELKYRLLKHNYEDLYFLIDIMDVLDIIKKKKSFKIYKNDEKIEFIIRNIKESKDSLVFKGSIEGLKKRFIHYDTNFNVLIKNSNEFEITIYVNKGFLTHDQTCLFIDKTDFNKLMDIKTTHDYLIPENLFLLKVKSKYLLEDILELLKKIIKTII